MSDTLKRAPFRLGPFIPRNYANAPIVEAIISLNVELPPTFEVEQLRSFHTSISADYSPSGEEQTVNITPIPAAVIPPGNTSGFRFASQDGRYVVACRANSFTLSRLPPYDNWEAFQAEAQRLWVLYTARYEPVRVTGLSVRYVNRIEIPHEKDQFMDFRWYLRTFPEVSSDLDIGLSGFIMRLDIPLKEINAHLILNEAMLPGSPSSKTISLLLDTDIVSRFDGEGDMWERLGSLRQAKNNVFEACMTNLTRELFT